MSTLTIRTKMYGWARIMRVSPVICIISILLAGFMVSESEASPYKLMADDSDVFDQFGCSVAVDGNTVLVGAYNHSQTMGNDGAVYVFNRHGSSWESPTQLMPLDAGWNSREFGYAVAMDANTAIVGAPWASGGGCAFIFQYDGIEWYQQARLVANDANGDFALFGCSVAIDGDSVLVGAHYDNQDAENSGAAYVFKRDGSLWTQQARLKPSDAGADQWFGYSVAIDANTAVVGAHSVGWNTTSGWAYIYQQSGSTWTEKAKLDGSNSSDCVAIDGRTVVVGNQWDWNTGVYTYEDISAEGNWSQMHTTTMTGTPGDFFGSSVAIEGDVLVVGAEHADGMNFLSGAVTVYRRKELSWIQDQELMADEGQWNDQFGSSVAISNGTIVVGAQGADGASTFSGAAYVFDYNLPEETAPTSSEFILCAVDYYGKFLHIDPNSGETEIIRTDLPLDLQALAYSPDGILYAATTDGDMYTIDPISGETVHFLSLNWRIMSMAFSPSGDLYATAIISTGPTVENLRILDINTGTFTDVGTLWGDGDSVQGLDFRNGTLYGNNPFRLQGETFGLYQIDLDDVEMHCIAEMSTADTNQSLAFAPDGSLYAIGGREFCQLNPDDGSIIGSIITLPGDFRGLEAIPLNKMVTAAGVVTLSGQEDHSGVSISFSRVADNSLITSVQTTSEGFWSQSGFGTGTYRVTPSKPGWTFIPAYRDFNSASSTLDFVGERQAQTDSFLYGSARGGQLIRIHLDSLTMENLPQRMGTGNVVGITYDYDQKTMYGITSYDGPSRLVTINVDSGAGQFVGTVGGTLRDIACNPVTGVLYGCSNELMILDPTDATPTLIGTIRRTDNHAVVSLAGLGFDEQGNIYGSGTSVTGQGLKELYSINISDASATYLSSSSPASFVSAIAFEPKSGQVFASQNYSPGPVSQLLTLDLDTGETSVIADFTDIEACYVDGLAFAPGR